MFETNFISNKIESRGLDFALRKSSVRNSISKGVWKSSVRHSISKCKFTGQNRVQRTRIIRNQICLKRCLTNNINWVL